MEIPKLIEELRHYGLSNGGSLGRHMGIMDLAADALEKLVTEKQDTDAHLKAINDSLCEQIRRAATGTSPQSQAIEDANELIRALIREMEPNPCDWCDGKNCETCSLCTENDEDECNFSLAIEN